MNERERDFIDAAQAIDDSIVMSVVRGVVDSATRPFQGRRMPTLQGPAYLVAALVSVITHAFLLQLIPDRLAPVKPLAYWMVVAFAAFVAVVGFHTTRNSSTATADSNAGTANTRKSSDVE